MSQRLPSAVSELGGLSVSRGVGLPCAGGAVALPEPWRLCAREAGNRGWAPGSEAASRAGSAKRRAAMAKLPKVTSMRVGNASIFLEGCEWGARLESLVSRPCGFAAYGQPAGFVFSSRYYCRSRNLLPVSA